MKLKVWHDAIEFSGKVLEKEPNNQKALFRRAQARLNTGMTEEAKTDIIAAIKLDPNNQEMRNFFKEIREREKQIKEQEK